MLEPLNSVPAFKILSFMDPNRRLINQEGFSSTLEESLNQEQHLSEQEDGDEPGDNQHLSLYASVSLSPGYRFDPRDHELINFYLKKKINKDPAPYIRMICSADVYQYSPWELTELYPSLEHDPWYFFAPRNRMYQRHGRVARDGYWKACGTEKKICHNNICIGSKKSLIFYKGKARKGKKTNWVMKEYAVDQPSMQHENMLDLVICRIHLKRQPSSRIKKQVAQKANTDTSH
ncbi:NAC domain-containing protein 2-like [Henckelia pumila]|uniref:NAC domain-containing protein 2-like n=1 Tax=Henckelia pumila TaxID=405737 RepID=UPI003C6E3032